MTAKPSVRTIYEVVETIASGAERGRTFKTKAAAERAAERARERGREARLRRYLAVEDREGARESGPPSPRAVVVRRTRTVFTGGQNPARPSAPVASTGPSTWSLPSWPAALDPLDGATRLLRVTQAPTDRHEPVSHHERTSWVRAATGGVARSLRAGRYWRCAHELTWPAVVAVWAPQYVMCAACAVPRLVEHDFFGHCDRCGGSVDQGELRRVLAPVECDLGCVLAYGLCPVCAARETVS